MDTLESAPPVLVRASSLPTMRSPKVVNFGTTSDNELSGTDDAYTRSTPRLLQRGDSVSFDASSRSGSTSGDDYGYSRSRSQADRSYSSSDWTSSSATTQNGSDEPGIDELVIDAQGELPLCIGQPVVPVLAHLLYFTSLSLSLSHIVPYVFA